MKIINTYRLPTLEAWGLAAREWISLINPGDWISLEGDMGVGKTLAVRSCLRAWGYEETVPSPTFPLLLVHEVDDKVVVHIDAFRLKGSEPWDSREWTHEIVFVEWAGHTSLPSERFSQRWKISRADDSDERWLEISAKSR